MRLEGIRKMIITREVNCLLGRRHKINEPLFREDDSLKIVHSSPRIHHGGFLLGPVRIGRIPLGGFVCHVNLWGFVILKFGSTWGTDVEAACHPTQQQWDVKLGIRIHQVVDLDGMRKIIWVVQTDLGNIIDDNVINTTLYGA